MPHWVAELLTTYTPLAWRSAVWASAFRSSLKHESEAVYKLSILRALRHNLPSPSTEPGDATPSALSWIFLSPIVVYEHFSHRFLSDNTRQEVSTEREKLNRPYE
ncbi:MAG: hypothetical protein QOD67_4634 [Caballeronia sp.]|nr:hypothetical protein [Caballeronia sp.]